MTVPDPDRNLLNGNFNDPEGLPPDKVWITRHFSPKKEGWRFAIYYLRMYQLFVERGRSRFLDAYREHTGSIETRKIINRWVKVIQRLQKTHVDALANKDMKTVFDITLGRKRRRKKKNI